MASNGGAKRRAQALRHLRVLCSAQPDRRPGSIGNREATSYAAQVLVDAGWHVSTPEFACLDWYTEGGTLAVAGRRLDLTPSPYGLGVSADGPLRVLRDPSDLEREDLTGSVVVLDGVLASEPLTPKAFPFYGTREHERIVNALESAAPAAVVAITGKYPALCGALDPFPLIEDGDFTIPTANVRPVDAGWIVGHDGEAAMVEIRSRRIPARARNVIATRGRRSPRVTCIAHIDTKPGTPGAVDNAAGVVALLLLAELMAPPYEPGEVGVELLLVNGEDHYAAPGEVAWLADNDGRLDEIALFVNIDGAGFDGGRTAYSTYNLTPALADAVVRSFSAVASLTPGPEWYQSDHAIFAMRGLPAVALTTELVVEMLDELFHTAADAPPRVDVDLLIDAADGLAELVGSMPPLE